MSRKEFTLHPLQEAADEKGSLVGPGRMYSSLDRQNVKGTLREVNENEKIPDQSKVVKKKKTSIKNVLSEKDKNAKLTVTIEDLTTDRCSEGYWELLCEQRQLALEATIKENEELHVKHAELRKRIVRLEEENRIAKEMLKHSESLVDMLKEMFNESEDTSDENSIIDNSYEG